MFDFDVEFPVDNSVKKSLLSPKIVLANDKTINLLAFVNVGSIK